MRAIVIDDSAFMRRAISEMLKSDPSIEVVATATNGKEGVELVEKHDPDVVTLDVEMPVMDGLTALKQIMDRHPVPVLMLSSLTTAGSQATLKALKLGAADFLAKDQSQISLSITNIQQELITKVKAIAPGKARLKRQASQPKAQATKVDRATLPKFTPTQFDYICIGSSTGGPPALETIITALPPTFHPAVIIAQHMPEVFTRSLAARLNETADIPVVHVEDGMEVQSRTIYISPGGHNTHIEKVGLTKAKLIVNDEPKTAIYKPSVDALLESAAKAFPRRTLGIVLTGIGADGVKGAAPFVAKGGILLGQDEASSVVYGMPKAVAEAGLIKADLPPAAIGEVMAQMIKAGMMTGRLAS